MILAGLRSLDSVSGSSYYGQLMEKIQTGSSEFITGRDSVLIDLRMDRVAETDKEFACRNAPMPDLSNEKIFPGGIKVKALFTPDMKWRLVEEFGPHCFSETDDGRLLFTADYTDMENLVTWLMTFGAKTEVLEPAEARDIIRRNAEETLKIYGGLTE